MTVSIAFFSGTGNTRHVAEQFARELRARNHAVHVLEIGPDGKDRSIGGDLLILCFPVHAGNAPWPVLDWIARQRGGYGLPTAVFSVSAGGTVIPNVASRVWVKRRLAHKGYEVVSEGMIVMPSNWIIPTKPAVAHALLLALPHKVAFFTQQVLADGGHRDCPGIGHRVLSALGRVEHAGARWFGQRMAVRTHCDGCGWCASHCPTGNIRMVERRPRFGRRCAACLRCVYGCPHAALSPGMARFVVLAGGYNLQRLIQTRTKPTDHDLTRESAGILWIGVRRYLREAGGLRS